MLTQKELKLLKKLQNNNKTEKKNITQKSLKGREIFIERVYTWHAERVKGTRSASVRIRVSAKHD
jgi:hypothetical protein